MDIIDRLNVFYTIKFTDQFEIVNRGDRKYYLLNTFDDRKYLLKTYQKNTNNLTKLKDSNSISHLVSKEMIIYSDYIISKEYDPIIEIDETTVGTLYSLNDGRFIKQGDISVKYLQLIADESKDLHYIGYELFENSFTIQQIEHINSVIRRTTEKIRSEISENGIHYLLENKFGVKLDTDIVNLNLSHVESINDQLKESKSTILNMDHNFDNITFSKEVNDGKKPKLIVSNIILDRVYTGHPYFEIGKTISRLLVQQKTLDIKEIKPILLQEISEPKTMQNQIIDAITTFYLLDLLYKYIKYENYRTEEERFEILKSILVKEKVLKYI